MTETIEDIVKNKLMLIPAPRGWNRIFCEVCGDGSRTKGPRGGWLFQEERAFYHCFNCNIDGSFDPNRDIPISKEMHKILQSFGIPEDAYKKLILKKRFSGKGSTSPEKIASPIKAIDIPDHFYKLSEATPDDLIAEKARAHLKWRNIDPTAYEFYLSTGISKGDPKEKALARVMVDRLIIPAFKEGRMVYYQARALEEGAKSKYISLDVPRNNIIYLYDNLYQNLASPLFVTEGFFDAFHLKGVSVMENKLTSQQIEHLQRSPRQKVVVPDRKGDSQRLALQAVELGWSVSIPDIGQDAKDIDHAIRIYGKLYVIHSVLQSIREGNSALAAIRLKL